MIEVDDRGIPTGYGAATIDWDRIFAPKGPGGES